MQITNAPGFVKSQIARLSTNKRKRLSQQFQTFGH